MRTTEIVLDFNDQPTKVVVKRATIEDGVTRYIMATKGIEESEKDQNESRRVLRLILYPNLMAATLSVEGVELPMSFDAFRDLDEDTVNRWADAVYELNPHWQAAEEPETDKKKSSRKK
jgi:hypothetical protein